jgi:hypothetical protein
METEDVTPIRTIIFFDLDAIPAAEVRCYDRSEDVNKRWKAVMTDVRQPQQWFRTMADAIAYVTHELGEQE